MDDVQEVAVLHHNALGLPCGAAGVDNIGGSVRPDRRKRGNWAGLQISQAKAFSHGSGSVGSGIMSASANLHVIAEDTRLTIVRGRGSSR